MICLGYPAIQSIESSKYRLSRLSFRNAFAGHRSGRSRHRHRHRKGHRGGKHQRRRKQAASESRKVLAQNERRDSCCLQPAKELSCTEATLRVASIHPEDSSGTSAFREAMRSHVSRHWKDLDRTTSLAVPEQSGHPASSLSWQHNRQHPAGKAGEAKGLSRAEHPEKPTAAGQRKMELTRGHLEGKVWVPCGKEGHLAWRLDMLRQLGSSWQAGAALHTAGKPLLLVSIISNRSRPPSCFTNDTTNPSVQ